MKRRRKKPPLSSKRAADQALLASMLSRLRAGADVRKSKVNRVRAALRVRTYVNLLKLHVAADRLADDLSGDG